MTTGQCCGTCKFFDPDGSPLNGGQCDAPVPNAYDHREEYPSGWTDAYLGTKCEAWTQIDEPKVTP